ncbi:HVA22-like protein [Vigna angularis]|uniref:HVA22-like protein n=1 Tax=Phaseolus angularis TaxID=3914 RepID=A0A8T0KG21_PHAAN|nr:HVA22-like protein [Vigna angularis]
MKVSLRPFISPVAPNLFLRTACCSIGLALPVYSTFKAIEDNDPYQQQRWLLYWAGSDYSSTNISSLNILPVIHDPVKGLNINNKDFSCDLFVCFHVLLEGARQLYSTHLRPFLLKHQARMDVIVEFVYGVMSKLIRDHQTELQLARTLAVKFLMTGTQMIRDLIHPVGRESNNIEPQKRQVQDSESED